MQLTHVMVNGFSKSHFSSFQQFSCKSGPKTEQAFSKSKRFARSLQSMTTIACKTFWTLLIFFVPFQVIKSGVGYCQYQLLINHLLCHLGGMLFPFKFITFTNYEKQHNFLSSIVNVTVVLVRMSHENLILLMGSYLGFLSS